MLHVTNALMVKVLRIAAEICNRHAEVIGGRISQDWHGDTSLLDDLTPEDKNELMFTHEAENSGGRNFEKDYFPYDEMVISFVVRSYLKKMLGEDAISVV